MNDWRDKFSMMIREGGKVETISEDIALKLADMVFRRNYGNETTENQLPLAVRDLGDSWEVVGSKDLPSSLTLGDPVGGRLQMVIRKVDCQITVLIRTLKIGPDSR